MADAILYGVVQKISVSLGSATLEQIGSIWGVKDDLEKLKSTFSSIQAVLEDAEEQQDQNSQVEDWLKKLRDASFDADDLLSEFSTHVLQQKVMGSDKVAKKVRIFFSCSNQLVFRLKMACKIKAIRERLNDISKDRSNFQLRETQVVMRERETQVVMGERETHSFVRKEEVIGREEEKKDIICLLQVLDEKKNVSFISIVGIGGLGKTTLAQYVYNDEKVNAHFELKMWVCVSEVFDVKTIVENMILSATKEKPESHIMEQLQEELRKILNQKMYLLVLDDVWNDNRETWDKLKTLLLDGKRGSKVVITTRTKLVADITRPNSQYFLGGLSDDQSWALLKQKAFEEGEENINDDFEAIGMDIVKKCQGVPLAIKIIGSVLFKKSVYGWLNIKNNELTTNLENGIMPVLKLSYNHLPSHLKCCFAYCSLFPKDYLIDKLTLIQLWIAQGFIQSPKESIQLEDVANEYFTELLWRSFFQEAKEDQDMNMKFKMHDLIHDLAQYVSRTDCTLVDSNAKEVNEKGRHLSFPFYNVSFFEENLNSLVKANKIRTFILAHNEWIYDQGSIEESTLKTLISTFIYVRTLDLHGLKMKMLPNTIDTLMHLKYLDLSSNDMEVLPSSITKLVNLQTLKLCKCKKLRELPVDIQKLVSLKHLDLKDCENLNHMPRGLGKLTSLQTLSLFVVSKDLVGSSKHCGGLAELNKLNDLRGTLEIKNLERLKDATLNFKAANSKVSELILRWNPEGDDGVDASDDENSMDSLQPHGSLKSLQVHGYMGVRVSSWFSFLTNLVDLSIYDCHKCQYLPQLYQLPTLRKLCIMRMNSMEYVTDRDMHDEISASLASPSTFFPSLEKLWLSNCPNLKGWWRSVDKGNEATTTSTISSSSSSTNHYHQHMPYFPRLSFFYFDECPEMTCMPLFPNLEERLRLWNSNLKALEETIEMNNTGGRASSFPSSSSSFSPPLSKLKDLQLCEMQKLTSLPEEWFKNLTSLQTLQIRSCFNLMSLPEGMSHLTSLQTLSISDCPILEQRCEKEKGDYWDKISHIPKLYLKKKMPVKDSELILSWNPEGDDGVDANDDENSMDSLQPHESLKYLIVEGYMGVRVSSWLSFLTNLVDLRINDCHKCQYLPPLYQLLTLRELSIRRMNSLEYVTDGDMHDEISASPASPSTFFPSLEKLWLSDCPNLKGWWRSVDKGNEATTTSTISSSTNHYHQHMLYFPRLSYFHSWDCPKMNCMPLFPNLEEGLRLWNSSLKALEETIEMNNTGGRASSFPSSSSSFSPSLSKLKELWLWEMQELESLPEEWFKNLTSLQTLQIDSCPNLTSLPEGMSHLTSLQSLSIIDCPKLEQRCEKEKGEDWDKISHVPNLYIS